MERAELCHDRYMDLLLAEYMQDVSAVKPMRNRYVQALDLSPGFSDFVRLALCVPRSGWDTWSECFWGGLDDLMQKKSEEGYVMIENPPEGPTDGSLESCPNEGKSEGKR